MVGLADIRLGFESQLTHYVNLSKLSKSLHFLTYVLPVLTSTFPNAVK